MARSAGAATTVLESLRLLYDRGGNVDLTATELIAGFEQVGVTGFTEEQAPYFLLAGTVLRLLLGHAAIDADVMFDLTLDDLAELGRDIDEQKFEDIAARFDEE